MEKLETIKKALMLIISIIFTRNRTARNSINTTERLNRLRLRLKELETNVGLNISTRAVLKTNKHNKKLLDMSGAREYGTNKNSTKTTTEIIKRTTTEEITVNFILLP